MQKTFTVSGLSAYVTKLEQIDNTTMANMQKEAEDYIKAQTTRTNADVETLTGLKYVGCYLKVIKPGIDASNHNWCELVYELSYHNSNGPGTSFNYYYCVAFSNLVLNGDNSISVDLTDYYTSEDKSFTFEVGDRGFWLKGYQTLKDLFDEEFTKTMDRFTYETNIQ